LIVPLAALLLSDLVMGFYSHMEVVYGSFLLYTAVPFGGFPFCASGI
jgi:hypothetical protein